MDLLSYPQFYYRSHYITSFFNDISKLREGTYIWNGKEWILKDNLIGCDT